MFAMKRKAADAGLVWDSSRHVVRMGVLVRDVRLTGNQEQQYVQRSCRDPIDTAEYLLASRAGRYIQVPSFRPEEQGQHLRFTQLLTDAKTLILLCTLTTETRNCCFFVAVNLDCNIAVFSSQININLIEDQGQCRSSEIF